MAILMMMCEGGGWWGIVKRAICVKCNVNIIKCIYCVYRLFLIFTTDGLHSVYFHK